MKVLGVLLRAPPEPAREAGLVPPQPSGAGPFGRFPPQADWLGGQSPLWGFSRLAAWDSAKMAYRSIPNYFQSTLLLFLAILATGQGTEVAVDRPYRWAMPVRLAIANCSEFPWVSDLPMTMETIHLIRRASVDAYGLAPGKVHSWCNGSAEEFLAWLKEVAAQTDSCTTLVLFFATHQRKDGRTRFARGPDLAPGQLVEAINGAAKHGQRLLFINDSCYAAALEKKGQFSDKVIRLYASTDAEIAFDLHFEEGPWGLDHFARAGRLYLQSRWNWNPKGMSFLGLIGLKAALSLANERLDTIDLRLLLNRMNQSRQVYDDEVRQAKVQHFMVVPADANLELLTNRLKGD